MSRKLKTLVAIAAATVVGFIAFPSSAKPKPNCYDLGKGQPASLEGKLTSIIFPGPPNYEDVRTGDTPEPAYVLQLPHPICLKGDEFADPQNGFSAVHLVSMPGTQRALRALLNLKVHVDLTQQMAAHTGHHHEPLVAWVKAVHEIGDYTSGDDYIAEYGTAATVIRAFYYALGDGDGRAASRYVIPEKRSLPAFSPERMRNYYGHLPEPLKLISIKASDSSTYLVHHTFRSKAGRCNGEAIVNTVVRGSANYIARIKALSGC